MIKIKKISPNAIIPEAQTTGSVGADLHACILEPIVIHPNETLKIPTGIAIALPERCGAFLFARSGLATKQGLAPANKVGVVDTDYRGEIIVALHNHSDEIRLIEPNQRIAQMVIMPVCQPIFEEVDSLEETERADGGFGSTGK